MTTYTRKHDVDEKRLSACLDPLYNGVFGILFVYRILDIDIINKEEEEE